jgi:hypothetical protein
MYAGVRANTGAAATAAAIAASTVGASARATLA